jgi:hypothetical protein
LDCPRHRPSGVDLGDTSPGRKVIRKEGISTECAHTHDVAETSGGPLVEPHASNLPIVVVESEIGQRAEVSGKIWRLSLQNITHPTKEIQSVSGWTPHRAVKSEF